MLLLLLLKNLPRYIFLEIIAFYGIDADQKKKMDEVIKYIAKRGPHYFSRFFGTREVEEDYGSQRNTPWYSEEDCWDVMSRCQLNADIDEYSSVKSRKVKPKNKKKDRR